MEMTHYMELMMGSWHMLVLFMAAPMLLAECYVVSEILLLIKPPQGGALAARSRTAVWKGRSAVAAVVVYLVLSHAAMVFGMFDPVQFGWRASDDMHMTHGAHAMPETHAGHVIH